MDETTNQNLTLRRMARMVRDMAEDWGDDDPRHAVAGGVLLALVGGQTGVAAAYDVLAQLDA